MTFPNRNFVRGFNEHSSDFPYAQVLADIGLYSFFIQAKNHIMSNHTAIKPPTTGSQTITQTHPQNSTAESSSSTPTVLSLKLKPKRERRGVKWTEDTVDNEHLNKKKSKKCCIYKKPKQFGESDSESDSDCEHHCEHDENNNNNEPVQKM